MDLFPEILAIFQRLVAFSDSSQNPNPSQEDLRGRLKALKGLGYLARSGFGDKQQLDQIDKQCRMMFRGVEILNLAKEEAAIREQTIHLDDLERRLLLRKKP